MANLPESSTFDAGVYQLELTDPVIGGPTGASNKPLINLANRTKYLKDQVDSLASSKAPLESPTFTGTPAVPTAAAGTNTTQAASTAFVAAAVSAAAPDLSPYAPKASPTFTGNPVAPTPAQFDNDTSLATTAFVQRALGNLRGVGSYSGSPTLTADQAGNAIFFTGAGGNVATLPALSATADGSVFYFKNLTSSIVTIQRAGSDYLYINNLQDTSITLATGEDIYFVKGSAASWWSFGGTGGLKKSAGFGASLSTNGYQKLPSGLIIQWGQATMPYLSTLYSNVTITLPIAYTTSNLFASAVAADMSSKTNNGRDSIAIDCVSPNNTSFIAYIDPQSASLTASFVFKWMSIGF